MFWSLHRFCGAPILLALVAGQAAYDSEGKEPEELQEAAMKVLRQLFGEAVPQPTACDASQWVCDKFTRGEAILTAFACNFRRMVICSCAPVFCMKKAIVSDIIKTDGYNCYHYSSTKGSRLLHIGAGLLHERCSAEMER